MSRVNESSRGTRCEKTHRGVRLLLRLVAALLGPERAEKVHLAAGSLAFGNASKESSTALRAAADVSLAVPVREVLALEAAEPLSRGHRADGEGADRVDGRTCALCRLFDPLVVVTAGVLVLVAARAAVGFRVDVTVAAGRRLARRAVAAGRAVAPGRVRMFVLRVLLVVVPGRAVSL